MKNRLTFLVFTFFLLSTTSILAQYRNSGYGGNGYGNNGYGGGMNQMSQSQPSKPKEIPVEVTVGKIMEEMKIALKLDELQTIAIANILTESIKEQGVLMKQNYSQEDQEKNFKALSEITDRKINQFLNPDQKEKYLIFKEEIRKPKIKEKRKKDKKDKE